MTWSDLLDMDLKLNGQKNPEKGDGEREREADRQTDRQAGRQTDRQPASQTDSQPASQAGRQTDRPIDY